MNDYINAILDRFCDDANSTGYIYNAQSKHIKNASWTFDELVRLHVVYDDKTEASFTKASAIQFISNCKYIDEDF